MDISPLLAAVLIIGIAVIIVEVSMRVRPWNKKRRNESSDL